MANSVGIGETTATTRPTLGREDSADILSYYHSSFADQPQDYSPPDSPEKTPSKAVPTHSRHLSTASSSSSDYSSDSEGSYPSEKATSSETSSYTTRRSSVPSHGSSDRRRVAIVQVDSLDETIPKSLLTKRDYGVTSQGELQTSDLALVAPPDVEPKLYMEITPSSLPRDSQPTTPCQDKRHRPTISKSAISTKDIPQDTIHTDSAASHTPVTDPIQEKQSDNKAVHPSISQSPAHSSAPYDIQSTSIIYTKQDTHSNSSLPSTDKIAQTEDFVDQNLYPTKLGDSQEFHESDVSSIFANIGPTKPLQVKKQSTLVAKTSGSSLHMQVVSTNILSPSEQASPYLHYQPGLHAIAGPLPPPPRAVIDIGVRTPPPPRPPRMQSPPPSRPGRGDIDAVKQALQLPPSVSAVLATRMQGISQDPSEDISISSPASDSTILHSNLKSISNHKREAAFQADLQPVPETPVIRPLSPERETSDDQPQETDDEIIIPRTDPPVEALSESPLNSPKTLAMEIPSVTIIEPPPRMESLSLQQGRPSLDSWVDVCSESKESRKERMSTSLDLSTRSLSPTRSITSSNRSSGTGPPSPPPKSIRNSLTTGLKRFSSLPRTPSLSRSARRSSGGTYYSSRTPSPPSQAHPPPAFKKHISHTPAALFCHEIVLVKSASERSAIYAAKINELYLCDCGLSEWVVEAHRRGPNYSTTRSPSTNQFTPRARLTSRSSMLSEATFPRRPDAVVATDLSSSTYRDITPPTAPPILPYPSLAIPNQRSTRSSSSAESGTPPSSIRSLAPSSPFSKSGGFFASLGRKASLSTTKREKSGPLTHAPSVSMPINRLQGRTPPTPLNISRPILTSTSNSPSAPGGPRAPPNRVARSQTLMTSPQFFSTRHSPERNEMIGKRPSMHNLSLDTIADIQPDPEFVRQVDKLSNLMPHANKDILAGYLRRAGQDVLAVGQYLEDEKNGTLRPPD